MKSSLLSSKHHSCVTEFRKWLIKEVSMLVIKAVASRLSMNALGEEL